MSVEPRHHEEYSPNQIDAARRVLIDLGQVLAVFEDSLVVVGGWVPDLLLKEADEQHIGSIDVDVALDAEKLGDGRYAELVETLLKTRRYHQTEEAFKLYADVSLKEGEPSVRVDVDFLKSPEAKLKKNRPKLTAGFRPLDAEGCAAAFDHPELVVLSGQMIGGARNKVRFRVASIADFLVMKAYALKKRDKPKDAYDICYCVEQYPGGMEQLANFWRERSDEKHVINAVEILNEKFSALDASGPDRFVEFFNSPNSDEREMQSRRAFELLQKFLAML